jgi:hypothetical protein
MSDFGGFFRRKNKAAGVFQAESLWFRSFLRFPKNLARFLL